MARSTGEYRGPILDEMSAKTYFVCECCLLRLPTKTSLQCHHKRPQLSGIDDSRENIACLCPTCHSTLHTLANSLAGAKSDKKSAYELASDYAHATNPLRIQEVVANLLEMATLVAQALVLKRSKQVEGGDIDTILTLPPKFNALFKSIGKIIKNAKGRPLGKEALIKMAVMDMIARHYPEKKDEVTQYIFTEILKSEAAAPTQAHGITAQRM